MVKKQAKKSRNGYAPKSEQRSNPKERTDVAPLKTSIADVSSDAGKPLSEIATSSAFDRQIAVPPEHGSSVLKNIAPGHGCLQSSADVRWSHSQCDAAAVLNSPKQGGYFFHTASTDPSPYWQVDLGVSQTIEAVVVFNREKYRERALSLQLWVSPDEYRWEKVFDNRDLPFNVRLFGGIQSGPRTIWTPGIKGRYFRLSLAEKQILHLDAVEIYASVKVSTPTEFGVQDALMIAAGGAIDVARKNLAALDPAPDALIPLVERTRATGKVAEMVIEHLAARFGSLEIRQLAERLIANNQMPMELAYGALVKGYVQSLPSAAKAIYEELALSAPDSADLRNLYDLLLSSEKKSSEEVIKLIIWDLDDTLWKGTLAEGDKVEIYNERRDFILKSIQRGLINSVCSKNDPDVARAKLREFGILDALTYPVFAFRPKGELVKQQIQALQLREQNVLFIDDNPLNLNEVKFHCPKIQTFDAREAALDVRLRDLLAASKLDGGKRHNDYRVLAQKLAAVDTFAGESDEFLRRSEIRIAVIRGNENFRFSSRIEELVNRSNQMNFLKTRIPDGTGTFLVGDCLNDSYSIFVRDRFGSYGLCGFAAVRRGTKKLLHFAFSCRIMNMGIENTVLAMIGQQYDLQSYPVEPKFFDYIKIDSDALDFASDIEDASGKSVRDIVVMANCQSGVIAHYLGAQNRVMAEQAPEIFTLFRSSGRASEHSAKYKILIYGIFVEYTKEYWPSPFSADRFRKLLRVALDAWSKDSVRVYVLVPPGSNRAIDLDNGGEEVCTVTDLNEIVRSEVGRTSGDFRILEISEFVQSPEDVSADLRHYSRTLLKRIGEHIRDHGLNDVVPPRLHPTLEDIRV